jgi:hypothetical protein
MNKQILSEEFRRMQKLAGIIAEKQLNEEELKTPQQLKTPNAGEYVVCKINSTDSPAPELVKLNGKFCIIEGSNSSDGKYYASILKLLNQVDGNSFEGEKNNIRLPEPKGVDMANGCDFSYFELYAIVKATSNNTAKRIKNQDGEMIDNPNYNPAANPVFTIVKKLTEMQLNEEENLLEKYKEKIDKLREEFIADLKSNLKGVKKLSKEDREKLSKIVRNLTFTVDDIF